MWITHLSGGYPFPCGLVSCLLGIKVLCLVSISKGPLPLPLPFQPPTPDSPPLDLLQRAHMVFLLWDFTSSSYFLTQAIHFVPHF